MENKVEREFFFEFFEKTEISKRILFSTLTLFG